MPARSEWKPGLTHIGTQKQLFLDDHRVESLKHAAFVMNLSDQMSFESP